MKKILSLSLAMLLSSFLVSCGSNSNNDTDQNKENKPSKQVSKDVSSSDLCPANHEANVIKMEDMKFSYYKYQEHICATLQVDLDKNKDWTDAGSGWFAAGFEAKTMKGANMFIFVPKNTNTINTQYNVFANVGGAYGPTKPLDTKPQTNQISILFSSLAKVNFIIYPNNIDGLNVDDQNVNIIFSHSKAGVTQFAPGHVAKYDGLAMNFG